MRIHVIKALFRSTSKVLLIRATTPERALVKAQRLKECVDVLDFFWMDSRPDDRQRGI